VKIPIEETQQNFFRHVKRFNVVLSSHRENFPPHEVQDYEEEELE
jgi:hypothetical protein